MTSGDMAAIGVAILALLAAIGPKLAEKYRSRRQLRMDEVTHEAETDLTKEKVADLARQSLERALILLSTELREAHIRISSLAADLEEERKLRRQVATDLDKANDALEAAERRMSRMQTEIDDLRMQVDQV